MLKSLITYTLHSRLAITLAFVIGILLSGILQIHLHIARDGFGPLINFTFKRLQAVFAIMGNLLFVVALRSLLPKLLPKLWLRLRRGWAHYDVSALARACLMYCLIAFVLYWVVSALNPLWGWPVLVLILTAAAVSWASADQFQSAPN
jgi:hypothetical protein